MKRIVWIAVVALGASAVANGMTTEVPGTKAPGEYGGAVAEKAQQPETKLPPALAGGVSQAARAPQALPAIIETPGPYGGFAATRRTTRRPPAAPRVAETAPAPQPTTTMGFPGSAAPRTAMSTALRKPFKFKLRDVSTGATYGPFVMRDGGRITLGEKGRFTTVGETQFVIQMVEGFKELKTPEQSALEAKLRRAVLPEMNFEEAKLTDVIDYLSREGDVNIVLIERVRKQGLTLTQLRLKNIPLYDAIRYVTEVIGVYFRIDDHAVVITDRPTSSRTGR